MKHIVLVDPFSSGHHTAYIHLFTKALLELNYCVWVFHDVKEVRLENWLKSQNVDNIQNVRIQDFRLPVFNNINFLGKYTQAIKVFLYWKHLASELRKIERIKHVKFHLVFFAWMDSFIINYCPANLIDFIFPYKWSGLYFHPSHIRNNPTNLELTPSWTSIDGLFMSKNCLSIGIHDEHILKGYSKRLNKKVVFFPEMADSTPPNPNNNFSLKIKKKAKGRLVIGTIGLEKHKGTLQMIRLAKTMNPKEYFFVFMGKKYTSHYSETELKEMNSFFESDSEHCFLNFNPLQEGEEYNSVFNSFDIIYLVYENFTSSSNRLTKAAIFSKYVLAQDTHCVGEDVVKYSLGEVTPFNDLQESVLAVEKLKNLIRSNAQKSNHRIYAAKHDANNLLTSFKEVLKA